MYYCLQTADHLLLTSGGKRYQKGECTMPSTAAIMHAAKKRPLPSTKMKPKDASQKRSL